MHLVCTKENLAKGVTAVQRAVSARGPLPILSYIKLEADGVDGEQGMIKLTATDLEVGMETRIPAEIRSGGSIALVAKTLAEIISKLPNAEIELKCQEGEFDLLLRCQRAKFTLRGLSASEFPELPRATAGTPVVLAADELARGIRQTVFAAASEDKAVISGLFIRLSGEQLELVATDGFRLAAKKTTVAGVAGELAVVVPKRAMDELARQLGAHADLAVAISTGHNQICFSIGDRYMTTRLIDGHYPNYRQIIPTSFEREAIVDRASLLAAVERVSIMAFDREAHTIKLEFCRDTAGATDLKLTAGNLESGEAGELLAVEYTGEPLAISFNAGYVVDALKHLDAATVRIGLNGALLPALIRPIDDDDQICLLMPVNRT